MRRRTVAFAARPLSVLALFALLASPLAPARAAEKKPAARALAKDAVLWVSTERTELVGSPVYGAEPRPGKAPDYEVFLPKQGDPRKMVVGYGGAFNEKGWEALQALPQAKRDEVLRRIFGDRKGLSLTMGRIPIGASDYALSRYSLDDTPGDYAMQKFSIERDRKALIPYVKAALAVNPALRFWASAWSPPPWMKDNGAYDSGKMKDDPKTYAAYALYLAKFVEAYKAEKINVEAVAVQNEPYVLTHYPSCRWEPAQYRTFVRDHLGPTLAQRKTGATVLLGTFNQPDNEAHARAVLEDPKARQYVGALGLQWGGLPIAAAARKLVPNLRVWQTETDCGNHHWEKGFDPARPQNDFAYATQTWRSLRDYLRGGAEIYMLWNIVLDETGKSIDARQPWPQNSPIVIDRKAKTVTYTPMFKAFAHWSIFARPGDLVLEGAGAEDAMAFADIERRVVVELMNPTGAGKTVRVKLQGRAWDAVLPARSFGTLIINME
jgi:glucosylceramidase